ncbi:MAG: phosphotransferase, partial [Proteobacteria bacterium]|nr:phosphotransferase [Pseudomonadota bacterium]NIS71443.1 phosphotransferase [Pseudomonadota bacterium]
GQDLPFINIRNTLEKSGLGVPKLYGAEPHQGLVFLEDLGDEILQKKIEAEKPESIESLYHEAIDMVVKMQCDLDVSQDCFAFKIAFTVEKFVWELDFFRTHYVESLLGKKIQSDDRKTMDRLFHWLSSLMDEERKVFTHRDYHSRNLIYHAGTLKTLDFQDARLGLAQYDLASLLRDSYVVLRDELRESLLDYYLSRREEKTGEKIDRPRFRYIFDMTSLQRNLKAIGTFAFQAIGRNNSSYLKYIPNTLTYVKKNLKKYDELGPYGKVLNTYLPFDER